MLITACKSTAILFQLSESEENLVAVASCQGGNLKFGEILCVVFLSESRNQAFVQYHIIFSVNMECQTI